MTPNSLQKSVKQVATPDLIVKLLKMFPDELQCDLLFDRALFGAPRVTMIPDKNNTDNRKMLILDNKDSIKEALNFKWSILSKSKSIHELFWHISKPNRLTVFETINHIVEIPEDEYSSMLKDIWLSTEFPHQMSIPRLLALFERANRTQLMDESDLDTFIKFPETITVYRGYSEENVKAGMTKRRGLSWTTDYKKALWFASRFNHVPIVLQAEINKNHIFMYTNTRSEKECVLNPSHLKNVRVIR
jgi:hypothetical protein